VSSWLRLLDTGLDLDHTATMSWRSRFGIGESRRSEPRERPPQARALHAEGATAKRTTETRTREQVEAMLAAGEVDFRGLDLSGVDFRPEKGATPLTFKDAVFGCHPPEKDHPPTKLVGTVFRGCTLEKCSFEHAVLEDADFRGCKLLDHCDFRYAIFRRVTFEDAEINTCDLYRSVFEIGCVLAKARLRGVSLTHAWLHGIVDLRRSAFEAPANEPTLQAEANASEYFRFLKKTEKDRSPDFTREAALREAPDEAALVYRHLSGVWAGQGHYDDATWAYVHTKNLERRFANAQRSDRSLARDQRLRAWRRSLVLSVADRLCRFGDSLVRVALWIAAVAILPGLIFWSTHAVETTGRHPHHANVFLSVMFSVGRLAAITPNGLTTSGRVVDGFVIVQSIVAITLIGLLGFVLGNKLRSS
jgi:uncharacterized protein YjbI with pentapeptide repeats